MNLEHVSQQCKRIILLLILLTLSPFPIFAGLASFTIDNDIFFGDDASYTNGIFFSWFDFEEDQNRHRSPSLMLWPLKWTLPSTPSQIDIDIHTIGQMMVTPEDISREDPDPDDLPYAGYLFYTTSHLKIFYHYADNIAITLGVVGPLSGAEYVQTRAHEATGSTPPRGWDHQLKNEPVIQISRSRIYRSWSSGDGDKEGKFDILLSPELRVGNLESTLNGSIIFRYGAHLSTTFASPILNSNRTANPLALRGGWYLYFGFNIRYIANMIFTDGNTFVDSRSTTLDHTQLGVMSGISYSFKNFSLTIATEDLSLLENHQNNRLRFGSLTIAFRF